MTLFWPYWLWYLCYWWSCCFWSTKHYVALPRPMVLCGVRAASEADAATRESNAGGESRRRETDEMIRILGKHVRQTCPRIIR